MADRMELWEAVVALEGLRWQAMHTREALRALAVIGANQWTERHVGATELFPLPWDEHEEEDGGEGESSTWSAAETAERWRGALEGITFSS